MFYMRKCVHRDRQVLMCTCESVLIETDMNSMYVLMFIESVLMFIESVYSIYVLMFLPTGLSARHSLSLGLSFRLSFPFGPRHLQPVLHLLT